MKTEEGKIPDAFSLCLVYPVANPEHDPIRVKCTHTSGLAPAEENCSIDDVPSHVELSIAPGAENLKTTDVNGGP
jgi:hypothetical protein